MQTISACLPACLSAHHFLPWERHPQRTNDVVCLFSLVGVCLYWRRVSFHTNQITDGMSVLVSLLMWPVFRFVGFVWFMILFSTGILERESEIYPCLSKSSSFVPNCLFKYPYLRSCWTFDEKVLFFARQIHTGRYNVAKLYLVTKRTIRLRNQHRSIFVMLQCHRHPTS